jgi:hypothetical protein
MREGREIVTDLDVITEADFESADWGDSLDGSYLRPKFESVAAYKLYRSTLDSGQDESHGNAVDWHRWSALFRNVTESDSPHKSEQPAAILSADSQGHITAEWYGDGNAAEEVWAALEKEWEEFDSQDDEEDDDPVVGDAGTGHGAYEFRSGH